METIQDIIEYIKTQSNLTYENANKSEILVLIEDCKHFVVLVEYVEFNTHTYTFSIIPNTLDIYYSSLYEVYKNFGDDYKLTLNKWIDSCKNHNLIYDKYKDRFNNSKDYLGFIAHCNLSCQISPSLLDFIMNDIVFCNECGVDINQNNNIKPLYFGDKEFNDYITIRKLSSERNQKLLELND